MDEGLQAVLGMSIAYLASGLGMLFAWLSWRKQQRKTARNSNDREATGNG